jgi:hypothetical protein
VVGDPAVGTYHEWQKYIFDIEVTANGNALAQSNNPGGDRAFGTHRLIRPSAIGTLDGVKSVQVSTGLWREASLEKEKARAVIDMNLMKDTLAPDTSAGGLKARIVCNDWAQAFVARGSKAPDYGRLKEAFKNNWAEPKNVTIRLAEPPYLIGKYWLVPVEVELESSDFESNCL